ncbi:helix-turn-helix domain-containing protein [Actinomycetospora endophytica]|uniref:Helix-turn-helix domain-containing protein n=1 Tax=Actinomycetospora endophytica TaxID=2291215 RepID=A0ABS8P3U9_9PSEU|nr:helix-turn-helix domain-containing protein [Actinomycetospora endophytica]MCD2192921.1 helix-turn-helix domain-containing protein [Actinomycetospora endophytica]
MRSLLLLGKMMAEGADERQIVLLASGAAPSLARCGYAQVVLPGDTGPRELAAEIAGLGPSGGPVRVPGLEHGWAWPLRQTEDPLGHLVVGGPAEFSGEETFLLRALAQQTGDALANRRLHDQEQATAATLVAVNDRLRGTVEALRRSMDIHSRLTAVAVSGEGQDGIARAVHDLTGLGVAIEDRYGNLQAWAGPDRPSVYPKEPPACRERLIARIAREARPLRHGTQVVALAHPQGDTLGAIVLHDPDQRAGEAELMALEHGATILAMELARVRSLAESELRLRRDVVDELLGGTDEESSLARAMALGYDLQRPHRVVVVEGHGRVRDDDAFFQAVRRAARDEPAGTLVVARREEVVLLADSEPDWEHLRRAVLRELGGGRARMGVGQRCEQVGDFPRSYRQARLALRLPAQAEWDDRAIRFDDLGVYQLLVGIEDLGEIERFVQHWLGKLLEYDTSRGSELVRTLAHHLERGGNYELTAKSLIVHRNTLKYRLQRIRQIAGVDLGDPDVWFNLHLATRAWRTLEVLRASR